MAGNEQIIKLYSALAEAPYEDFGWDKGLENAKAHNYKKAWITQLPSQIWDYCAAVGNPFELGTIEEGSTVVDLGCGAGVDLLISALLVGEKGKVIGVDITPKMVAKAKAHALLAGFNNIEVLERSFDDLGLADESVDVVISNGAINLTSCKESVFSEVYRVLKPQGKMMFADMIDVSDPTVSQCCSTKESEGDWANCVAGTLSKEKLMSIMEQAGFGKVQCHGLTHYTTAETTRGATFTGEKIAPDLLRQSHWDKIFQTKDYQTVLWHQTKPTISLGLINNYAKHEDRIIDVGCGASFLVDHLLAEGFTKITLLDTAKSSLDIVKTRLDSQASIPDYQCVDIMNFKAEKIYNLWHDRAVFHFLLQEKERQNYFEVLKQSLVSGGIAVISTFAVGGQTQCAGLDIVQYDKKKMLEELPLGLELMESNDFIHITPANTEQQYSAFIIRKS